MSSTRKLPNGRTQASIQDKFRGIKRTKRTFDTKKEADDWLAAVRRDATDRLLGNRRRRVFGEALARYLREESPKKRTHHDDLSNAAALRWPAWDTEARRWLRLEETPLDETPAALAKWVADLRAVVDRRYLGAELYQLRPKGDGRAWYVQPDPREGDRPEHRREVTDLALIARLNKKRGRGPFASATLRIRQLLVSATLFHAWKYWSTKGDVWLEQNITEKIQLAAPAQERGAVADYDTLLRLIVAAPEGFDAAILAGAWIGWRRSNLLGGYKKQRPVRPLGWDHVVFPIYQENDAGELVEVQHGYYWVDRFDSKNKKPLAQPMSRHVEQLLRLQWDRRNGPHVFHRGDGTPFANFKKLWASTKRRAGVDEKFRWHDLRHTWATNLMIAGGDERHVQQLGGWQDRRSMERYTHLRLEHLRTTAELRRRTT